MSNNVSYIDSEAVQQDEPREEPLEESQNEPQVVEDEETGDGADLD